MNAGMDGYLTKPLNQKVLAEALRKYCNNNNNTPTTTTTTTTSSSSSSSPPLTPQINIVTEALAITET